MAAKEEGVRAFFSAAKSISGERRERKQWTACDVFPGEDTHVILEQVAQFFTEITDAFVTLETKTWNDVKTSGRHIEPYQIAAGLRSMKKPRSQIPGDIMPCLVSQLADIVAIPLAHIYNQVLGGQPWPSVWKEEVVTIIPKNSNPKSLAECHNLSCTSLFSKWLERLVLGDIKKSVSLGTEQYGGIQGMGTEHFLADGYNEIFKIINDPNKAANIVSIDFSKAFNRVDHEFCVKALRKYGASDMSAHIVRNFLAGRVMTVKVGNSLSLPRALKGGSPQGSIIGGFLYCLTANLLEESLEEIERLRGLDLEEVITKGVGVEIRRAERKDYVLKKFIDDYNIINTVQFTSEDLILKAVASENVIKKVEMAANAIGMAINKKKTQIMCVKRHGRQNLTTSVEVGGETIGSCFLGQCLLPPDGQMLGLHAT